MTKLLIGIIVILIVGAGLFIFINQEPRLPVVPSNCTELRDQDISIIYTANKIFEPYCVKITSGSSVTWKNESGQILEIGADPHPIHSGNREVSNDEFVLEVSANSQQTVQLFKTGVFGYHDHLNETATGIIVVE